MVKEKDCFTVVEVANRYKIKPKTLYSWIAEGKIEAVRIGPSKLIRLTKTVVESMAKSTLD